MKKLPIILLLIFVVVGCDKDDGNGPGEVGLIDKPTKIFEVLKGEWIWYSYYIKDPASKYDERHQAKHTSIIHIISQNADSSINYKVYTNYDRVCSDSVTFYKEGTFKTGVSYYQGEAIATINSNIIDAEETCDYLYCDIKGSWGNDTVNDLDFIVIDANSSSSIVYNYSRMAAPITVAPFDSLKGDWKWVKTSGGFAGETTDAEYPATIQILSQNADSSINFKTFTNGTLLKEGTFMNKIASINCGVYRIRVFDQNITSHDGISTFSQLWYQLRNDTLIFEDWDATDSFVYHYAKVK